MLDFFQKKKKRRNLWAKIQSSRHNFQQFVYKSAHNETFFSFEISSTSRGVPRTWQAQTLALRKDIVLSKKLAAQLKIPESAGPDADKVRVRDVLKVIQG